MQPLSDVNVQSPSQSPPQPVQSQQNTQVYSQAQTHQQQHKSHSFVQSTSMKSESTTEVHTNITTTTATPSHKVNSEQQYSSVHKQEYNTSHNNNNNFQSVEVQPTLKPTTLQSIPQQQSLQIPKIERALINPKFILTTLKDQKHRFVLVLECETRVPPGSSPRNQNTLNRPVFNPITVFPARFTVGGPKAGKDPRTVPMSDLLAICNENPEVQLPAGKYCLCLFVIAFIKLIRNLCGCFNCFDVNLTIPPKVNNISSPYCRLAHPASIYPNHSVEHRPGGMAVPIGLEPK
jgi:hypothetical protein